MALSSLRFRRSLNTLRCSLSATPPLSPSSAPSSSSSRPLFLAQSASWPSWKWSRSSFGGGNNHGDDRIETGKELEKFNSFSILRLPLAAAPPIRVSSLSKQFLASLPWPPLLLQSRHFRLSPVSLKSSSSSSVGFEPNYSWSYEEFKPRELGIDAIEGCDFNHWLIVMDFPKDPRPSPDEMVRSYEETCAKALGISVEEAKKKIYACSTSNYTGFHVKVTEIESEKFNGQPGVVFVLPDSYSDPEKKEYGGDKYINGVILPRPRPTLDGRRNRDQPKHEQHAGPMPNQQGSPSYSQEGPTQRGLKPNQQRHPSNSHQVLTSQSYPSTLTPQSYPSKQDYGALREEERRGRPNHLSQQSYGQPEPRAVYAPHENNGPPATQNYSFGQNCNRLGQGERRDVTPMAASGERNHYQQGSEGFYAIYPGNYDQGGSGNFYPRGQRGSPPGDQRHYAPPRKQGPFREDYQYYGPPQGTYYGQGVGGYQGQGPPEAYWQGANSGWVGRGTSFGYEQGYPGYNQGQLFSPQARWNLQGANSYPQEQREFVQGYQMNYAPHYAPYHAPPRYQGHFREDHQNHGPAQGTFYGQGAAGYQCQVPPVAYWQGAPFGYGQGYPGPIQGYSFSQEQLRYMQEVNYYSQEHREFSQGGWANSAPPRHQGGCWDYQNYRPVQGAPYGQGVGEYQGHGNPYQQGSYNQRGPGNFSVQEQRQSEEEDQRNYAPPRQ